MALIKEMVRIPTRPCIVCGDPSMLEVEKVKLAQYKSGVHVQDVWPEWSADKRELMITGTHPKCWDTIFAGDNE